jgi:hypothetical protein
MWVLPRLDDIASDLSVFHRVDDLTALDGPTFFRLAWRLPAYQGVMRARLEAEQEEHDQSPTAPRAAEPQSGGREWNPGTQTTLMADPNLKGIFSFG